MLMKQEYKLDLLKIKARGEAVERRLANTALISAEDLKWLREIHARIPEATKKCIRAKMWSSRSKSVWPV